MIFKQDTCLVTLFDCGIFKQILSRFARNFFKHCANPESGINTLNYNLFQGRFWKSFGLQIQEIWSRCYRRHSHASRHRRRWKSSQSDHLHQNGSISRSIQTYGSPYRQAWNGQQTGWFRTQQKYWKPISYQFCNFNFHFFLLSLKFWNKSWIRKLCNLFSYFW